MTWSLSIPLELHIIVAGALTVRILYRRLEVNTALAWIVMLVAMPIAGPILYFLFGDHSLGRRRVKLSADIRRFYQEAHAVAHGDGVPPHQVGAPFDALARSLTAECGFPVLSHNSWSILTDAGETLDAMARDIDQARQDCRLEFYIIDPRGRVEAVLEAVLRAAARGVACKILADDYGSKPFFRSPWPERLRDAGVQVVRSLPVGLLRSFSRRSDLRNHRKLLICDRRVAYIGSANLVDPRLFKAASDVGQWIDAMMRVEGEMVDALTCVFAADYLLEDGGAKSAGLVLRALPLDRRPDPKPAGQALMQLLPSGPEMLGSPIYAFIVAAIFNARERVRVVTPYFIPDDAIMLALTSAARRGVTVQVIVPERLDTWISHYASRASYQDLLAAGVSILQFSGGLLHTKAVLIDDEVSVFGTVNMDPRSFHLNLELSLILYEPQISAALHTILDGYVARSAAIDPDTWARRPATQCFLENLLRLAAPLL